MIVETATRDLLIDIVRRAAKTEILPLFRNLGSGAVSEKTSAQDLVTIADTAAEAMIREEVLANLPHATVVGEEAVSEDWSVIDGIADAAFGVIIDPIDGTWNFAKGVATFGVILAVTHKGETVFGLLYDPICDDWIWAAKGEGAWHSFADGRTERLAASTGEDGLQNVFYSVSLFERAHQEAVAATIPQYERAYTLRCACHEYRQLAAGNVDFALHGKLMPWDHAAGVLVHLEAGGAAGLLDGRDYAPTLTEGRLLLAPNPEIWAELRDQFAFLEGPGSQ